MWVLIHRKCEQFEVKFLESTIEVKELLNPKVLPHFLFVGDDTVIEFLSVDGCDCQQVSI